MKRIISIAGALAGLMLAGQAFAQEPVWTTSGLNMPESVEFDAARDRFYVSNVAGGVAEQDGNGTISLLDGDGKLLEAHWITGLHSPKGLALHGRRLYVADVKQLVVIDVDQARVVARYEAGDSKVLNGITVDQQGQVYVSDWIGNRIYTLRDGELSLWLDSPDLNSPNGLWLEGGELYVASWGSHPKDDFSTETSGSLKRISLKTRAIQTLEQEGRWINMDGISLHSRDQWLVSDFLKGEILLLDARGHVVRSVKSRAGSADFFYIREKGLLVVPLFMDNQVVAYKVE